MIGHIFNIQKYCLHDGPGIRTTVFFKGCPLHCIWCSNPESQHIYNEIMVNSQYCKKCGLCVNHCPSGARSQNLTTFQSFLFSLHLKNHFNSLIQYVSEKCTHCNACINVCHSGAIEKVGLDISIEELMVILNQDKTFYESSGGGITFSGGEPFLQPVFLTQFVKECKKQNYHLCLETTAYTSKENLQLIMKEIDLFLIDLKHMNSEKHKEYTGVGNKEILSNIRFLVESHANLILRFPLIPTINDSDSNITEIIRFMQELTNLKSNSTLQIEIIPYHRFGIEKYIGLGKSYQLMILNPPSPEIIQSVRQRFLHEGIALYSSQNDINVNKPEDYN